MGRLFDSKQFRTDLELSGSFSGSFTGDGSSLTNVPASGIVGLNLSQIASGSATASIAPDKGFRVNVDTEITGSLDVTGDVTASAFKGDGSALTGILKTTGTPADNQIPIFTDSSTIEGTSSFTYNSTTRELLLGASSAGSTETNTLRIQGYSAASSAFLKLGWNNWGGTTIESGFSGTTKLYSYGDNAPAGGRLILGEGGDTGTNQSNYLWIRGDNDDDAVHIYLGNNSTTYSSEIGIERQEGTGVDYESDIALRAAAGLSQHKSEYIFSRKGMFQAQDAGFTVSGSGQVFVNIATSSINPTTKITGFDQALVVNGDITASGLFATTANITGSFKGNGSALTNLKVGSNPARVVFTTTDGELTTESGFDYNSSTNQLTVDSINVVSFTSSFITSSTIESSGSHTFGDSTSDTQILVGTILMSGSAQLTGSLDVNGHASATAITSSNGGRFESAGTAGQFIIKNTGNDADAFTVYMTDAAGQANIGAYGGINFISRYGSIGTVASYNNVGTWGFNYDVNIAPGKHLSGSATSTASFGTYLGDGSQLDGIVTQTTLSQSIFVTPLGNDSTGAVGDLMKPFATLESASMAATTGSTIFVYPGLYEPVSGSNLAFEGGAYYFYPNTVVSKSTDGDIFDATGITTGFSVYGQAEFYTYNNADRIMFFGDGTGAWPGTPYNWVFECKDFKAEGADAFKGYVSNRSGDFLIPGDHTACFRFSNGISTGGSVFSLPGLNTSPYNTGGIIRIDANRIESTSGAGISTYYGGTTIYVTANEVTGTTYGISSGIGIYYQNLYADIENCYGATAAYKIGAGGRATISGKANKIIQSSGVVSHQGDLDALEISGGQFAGDIVRAATISGGEVNFAWDTIGNYNNPITITGGTANVSLQGSNAYTAPINVNGGKLYLNGFQFGQNSYGDITINGGELIFDGKLDRPTINYQSGGRWCFQLISGTLRLRGYVNNSIHTGTNPHEASCVRYEGGTLILDGCTLTTSASYAPPIHVIGQDREVKILASGVNTNKTGSLGLLEASSSFGSGGYALTNIFGGMIIEDSSIE